MMKFHEPIAGKVLNDPDSPYHSYVWVESVRAGFPPTSSGWIL
jgi:hypothetical protein